MADFQPLNLAQIYQSADASANMALQTNLLTLQATKMRQDFQEEDQLRNLAKSSTVTGPDGSPSFDLRAFTKGAYSINPMKAIGYEKAAADAEKATMEKAKLQGDIDEQRMKGAAERLKHMNEASTVPFVKYKELVDSGVPEPEARAKVQPLYEAAIKGLVNSGMFTPQQIQSFKMPAEFDPTLAEAGMNQVLGAKEQLTQFWEKKKFNQTTRGQDITIRGQDLTDARARENVQQGWARLNLEREKLGQEKLGAPQEVTVDGKPMMAAFDKTAKTWVDTNTGQTLQNVQPKDQGGTDTERVVAGYASRMKAAEQIMSGLSTAAQKPGALETAGGKVVLFGDVIANELRGEARQKALQAQNDWVRAKLRKESGAVIGPKEMEDEQRTYFPQIGDSEAVVKQKQEARRIAAAAMEQQAGRAARSMKVSPEAQAARDQDAAALRAGEGSVEELQAQVKAYEDALKKGVSGDAKGMIQRDLDLTKKALAIKQNVPIKITGDADYAKVPKGARYIDPNGVERVKG